MIRRAARPETEYPRRLDRGQSMAMPRYPTGCAAGSQECGDASAWASGDAWYVNANNGNVNTNNRNNTGFALAVRGAGEFQGAVPLQSLYEAWKRARRRKVPSENQKQWEWDWSGGLLALQRQIEAGAWSPRPSVCFIAQQPKAREIHAPHFADRVVHHWLVPQLEAVFESGFIFDSYANRRGKGTHAAVQRLQTFVRQVESGQGPGWYLQLDIHNFFNSIHRPTLWSMLKRRMARRGVPEVAQRVVHALLRHSPLHAGVTFRATDAERAAVPEHKRLESAAPGCGLPIGNLSSQFFANVYLDALDQFVKHQLKASRYLRYVDDFVLIHRDREQLVQWQQRIEQFLAERLLLKLKPDIRLRPLRDGIDFLGYVVRPTHTLVRRRVVIHARAALAAWEHDHVRGGAVITGRAQCERARSVWGSYGGHFRHASTFRLRRSFHRRFPWLVEVIA